MTITPLRADPATGTAEQRTALTTGLVDFATLVATNPQLPIVRFGGVVGHTFVYSLWPPDDMGAQRAEVDRVAGILGVQAELMPSGLYVAERHFGPVSYRASTLPERKPPVRLDRWSAA